MLLIPTRYVLSNKIFENTKYMHILEGNHDYKNQFSFNITFKSVFYNTHKIMFVLLKKAGLFE